MAILELNQISKSFPGVKALSEVNLSILPGEIHALCGENGAGKSTLMNILAGNLQPDSGTITLRSQLQTIQSPINAFQLGISIVYQHLSLVENLSIAENIFANQQPRNKLGIIQFDALYKQTKTLLQQLQLDEIDPETPLSKLSIAQKQMVEIAKALSKNPSIFILDEPTASITEKETTLLFSILKKLRNQGVSIIYISHRLEEIFSLADRISILKDGKHQGTFKTNELTKEDLIKRMVGRDVSILKSESHVTPEILLSVKNLTGPRYRNITFQLHRGEILGIAGLVGAGRTEIARAIFGADKIESGEVILENEILRASHPIESISKGLAYVPEERKALGLFPDMSIQDNIVVANPKTAMRGRFLSTAKAKQLADKFKDKLRIVTPDVQQKVNNLSGGNQQKVVLAKWLNTNPTVLIVDEPTNGIDVGAKFEIYEILKHLAAEGKGIIIISSDLPELLGICDRIVVIKKGIIAGEFLSAEASEENIMALASN